MMKHRVMVLVVSLFLLTSAYGEKCKDFSGIYDYDPEVAGCINQQSYSSDELIPASLLSKKLILVIRQEYCLGWKISYFDPSNPSKKLSVDNKFFHSDDSKDEIKREAQHARDMTYFFEKGPYYANIDIGYIKGTYQLSWFLKQIDQDGLQISYKLSSRGRIYFPLTLFPRSTVTKSQFMCSLKRRSP